MVGPTRWIEAGAVVLGLAPEAFLDAYLDSQARAGEMAIESSLVGAPLRDMLDAAGRVRRSSADEGVQPYVGPVGFEGTAEQLLDELNEFMTGRPYTRGRGWPGTPRGMSAALRRIAPALRKLGYTVSFARQGRGNDQHRIITVATPATKAPTIAYNANDRSHRSHRSPTTPAAAAPGNVGNGGNDGNGRKPTQTNKGHSKERDAVNSVRDDDIAAQARAEDRVSAARDERSLKLAQERARAADVRAERANGQAKAAPCVKVGDRVQWAPGGVAQIRGGAIVTGLSDCGGFVFVDLKDCAAGLPVAEISVLVEGPPDPPAPKSSSVNPPQVTPLTEFVVNLTAAREETAKAGVGDKIKPKAPRSPSRRKEKTVSSASNPNKGPDR